MRLTRIIVGIMVMGSLAGGMTACLAGNAADDLSPLAVSVVSSRPDMVTGGDALVLVEAPEHDLEQVSVTVNGSDITAMFRETCLPRDAAVCLSQIFIGLLLII